MSLKAVILDWAGTMVDHGSLAPLAVFRRAFAGIGVEITDDAVAMKMINRILPIAGPDAIKCSKELATKEGIFVGITSGATFAGALQIAADAEKGANILCMLPDTGERYLSTPLFGDVSADMNEEELKISRSTPGAQLNT